MTRKDHVMRTLETLMLVACLAAIGGAAEAQGGADCYHNGQAVADGTRIGELVCSNGVWVKQP